MSVAVPQPAVLRRSILWYRLTPGRAVVGLLVVECLLWLSNWLGWPHWHRGYAVLTAVALVPAALMGVIWFAFAVLFRWRFQFGIRLLLLLTLVVAIPCSWLAVQMKKARQQKVTVNAIVKAGGVVSYDYAANFSPGVAATKPRGLVWLRKLLEDDFFNDVDSACFDHSSSSSGWRTPGFVFDDSTTDLANWAPIDDGALSRLESLTQLRRWTCRKPRSPTSRWNISKD